MILKTIAFKREAKSKTEVGIEIENSVIIDKKGKVVEMPIWNAIDVIGMELDLYPLLNSLSKYKWKI